MHSAVTVVWQGSLIYKDQIAEENDPLVDVLLQSGVIILGKTNTPEFGAGANTFNKYTQPSPLDCTSVASPVLILNVFGLDYLEQKVAPLPT